MIIPVPVKENPLWIFFGKGRNFILLKLTQVKNKTTPEKKNVSSNGLKLGSGNREVRKAEKVKHELRVTQWKFLFMVTSLDVNSVRSDLRVMSSDISIKSTS